MLYKAHKTALSLSAGLICALLTTTAFADDAPGDSGVTDIWGWLDYALKDLYNKFLLVSTIAACVAASVCLSLMNFSTETLPPPPTSFG